MSAETQTPPEQAQQQAPSLPVTVRLNELSATKVQLQVTVDPEHVQRAFRSVYRELSREGRVPGFRPGKVPREVLKRHFGEEAIKAEVIRELAPQAYTAAVQQSGIHPLAQPDLRKMDVQEDGPLTLSARVMVLPRLKPEQYKGLSLRRPVAEITDDDVDEEIKELRENLAGWADADREEVREGDLVTADVTIEAEGQEPVELEDEEYRVGSEDRTPPIADQLVGARLGQTLTIETSYPEDYGASELAGKSAKATVTIKKIHEWRLPEPDDEFARANYGFDTIAQLREDIRENLAANAAKRAEEELRTQALDALQERLDIDLPDEMVADEAKERMRELEHLLLRQGMSAQEVRQRTGQARRELERQADGLARRSLTQALLLEAVGRAEGIEASEEDVEAKLRELAAVRDLEPDDLRVRLERGGGMAGLRDEIRTQKILDFLVQNANVQDVPLDEYLAQQRERQDAEEEALTAEDESEAQPADLPEEPTQAANDAAPLEEAHDR